MDDFQKLNLIKENIAKEHDPAILFAMNKVARRLEKNIEKIKQKIVNF